MLPCLSPTQEGDLSVGAVQPEERNSREDEHKGDEGRGARSICTNRDGMGRSRVLRCKDRHECRQRSVHARSSSGKEGKQQAGWQRGEASGPP